MKLYTRIVLTISLLLMLAIAGLSYVLISNFTSDIVATNQRDLEATAQLLAFASSFAGDVSSETEEVIGEHLVAEARLTAQLVSVAEQQAGMAPEQINALLRDITSQTGLDEIRVTDDQGRAYLSSAGDGFIFSPNPLQQPQMYIFWDLLAADNKVVIDVARPQEGAAAEMAKYAGVSGIDQPRIVQVGYASPFLHNMARSLVTQQLVDSLTGQGNVAFIRVVNNNNTTLVTSSRPLPGYVRDLADPEWQLLSLVRREHQPHSTLVDNVLISAAPIQGNEGEPQGVVLVYQTTIHLTETVQAAVGRGLVLTAVALVLGLLASFGLARIIVGPIVRLGGAAQALARGDSHEPIRSTSVKELNALGVAFSSMADQLRASYADLEQKVHDRTAELSRRLDQLDLINRVGRDATSLITLDQLLPQVAQQIRTTFNYYTTMIFLLDEDAGEVRLRAAATPSEINLLEEGLALPVGKGLIGHVAASGEALVAGDVSRELRYHTDERLPLIRSELVLPLPVGMRVLGVLEMSSTELDAFSPQDVQVLQTLADQIAIAIRNAQLYQNQRDLFLVAEQTRTEAEEANRLKTRFLSNMSHELRTPLNSIINFTRIVMAGLTGPVTDEQLDHLGRVASSGDHLLGLINDLLDLSKIEAGQMQLYRQQDQIRPLIQSVLATAAGLTRDSGVPLRMEVDEHLPPLWFDKVRIRQVLLNLISNAAKFTRYGSITVRASLRDPETLLVAVADTGDGIPPEHQQRIFEEFQQVKTEHQHTGTGLGLPISKRLVEMHGDTMWLESAVGHGATFFFTLPLAKPE